MFAGVPDFDAELLVSASTGDGIEIGEWRSSGTDTDGSPFVMCGVTVMRIEDDHIVWGRLYMQTLELDGADIDNMIRDICRSPASK